MSYGWCGRILMVDLTRRTVETEPLPRSWAEAFLGGRGLNARTLFELAGPGLDPLGPENPLIFGTGPAAGTLIPGSSRFTVTAYSPLTILANGNPCFGDSNAGGAFAAELKYAGFDQIIFTGQSDSPVYLAIDNGRAEIRAADHLWGLDTETASLTLRTEAGDRDAQVACIGPAGERLSRMACVVVDCYRAAGKCGMGAVMGSKSLKAVVVRGTRGVKVADPAGMRQVVRDAVKVLYQDPSSRVYSTQGTSSLIKAKQKHGRLNVMNHQYTIWDRWEDISAEAVEGFRIRSKACFSCQLHCSHYYRVDRGPFTGAFGEGPENAATGGFGSNLGNADLPSVLYANTLCNKLGLDVTNTSGTVAWAMECWQRGLLDEKETDGLDLAWGNASAIVELIRRVGLREGYLGDLLAEGALRAARTLGRDSERYVMHGKGQYPAGSDPRGAKAWGLGYAVASRGGDHLRALPATETFFTPEEAERYFGTAEAVKPGGVKGKGALVKWSEDQRAVADSLEICKLVVRTILVYPEWEARFLAACTGLRLSPEETLQLGERVVNLERLINLRSGLTRKDDDLCERYRREPIPSGPARGQVLDLDPMLDEYYQVRGWTLPDGIPTREKLCELGLEALGKFQDGVNIEKGVSGA